MLGQILFLFRSLRAKIDPAKLNGIHRVVNAQRTALAERLVCIFTDISALGSDTAHCHTHERQCRVPGCDLLVVGT